MEDDIKKIKEKDAKDIYAAIKETKIESSLKGKMLYLTVLKNEMNSIKDNKVFDKDENLIGFIYVTLE